MNTRDLKKYVKTLRLKAKEILIALPDVPVTSDTYRSLIVNFNNTYATIQEFENIINELEAQKEKSVTE